MSGAMVQPQSEVLTAADRCDRCGGQAYVRVELKSGGELHWCGHHWREHGTALADQAAVVTDETWRLEAGSVVQPDPNVV